ncbi:MAG: hypothetical protein QW514_05370 [Thermoprotei archaeon]
MAQGETLSVGNRRVLTKTVVGVTIVFLFTQFLTGMWVNMFVSFPSTPYSGGFFGMMGAMMSLMYIGGGVLLMIHMMMGYLILLFSLVALVAALLVGRMGVAAAGIAGFASVVFAGVNGLLFMLSGFTDDLNSYFMAVGFLLAFTSYFAMLYFIATEK